MAINPIVEVYIPIIRIPIKGGMTIPNIATFDHGTTQYNGKYPQNIPRGSIKLERDVFPTMNGWKIYDRYKDSP